MRVLKNDKVNQYGRRDTTNEDKLIYQEIFQTSLTFNFIIEGFSFQVFMRWEYFQKS